jgi:hypothetical protein
MFDPNQGLERPARAHGEDLDLVGAAPTPYVLPPPSASGRASFSDGEMQHHGAPGTLLAVGAGTGAGAAYGSHQHSHPPSAYTHSSDPSAPLTSPRLSHGFDGSEFGGTDTSASSRPMFPTPLPASVPAPTGQIYDPRSAKEREAMAGRLNVRNEGGSSVPRTSDGVIIHQDGGRYREDEDATSGSNEIPPTYDSIRHDNDGGSRA